MKGNIIWEEKSYIEQEKSCSKGIVSETNGITKNTDKKSVNEILNDTSKTKQCAKCKREMCHSEFYKDKHNKFGLTSRCKKCYGFRTNDEIKTERERRLEHLQTGIKICKYCQQPKPLSDFSYNKSNIDKLNTRCKECFKPIYKKHRIKHRKSILDYGRNRKFSQHYKEKSKIYSKKRRANPFYRAANNVSRGIRRSIGSDKGGHHWEDVVGYTFDELKSHLEKQFVEGMTWENYGTKWHIDHIRPMCSFNIQHIEDEEFKQCWALKNLQPLWALDNQIKNGKWITSHSQ